MSITKTLLITSLLMVISWENEAKAQLFGNRGISGRNNIARPRGVAAPVRRNRSGFVGGDRRNAGNFVGGNSNRRSVRSSTAGLRRRNRSSGNVNQPIARPSKGQMYLPRLSLETIPGGGQLTAKEAVTTALTKRFRQLGHEGITVSMEKRKALLTGVVESAKAKRLATLLASFEPGVSEIQNDLAIADDSAIPPAEPDHSLPSKLPPDAAADQ